MLGYVVPRYLRCAAASACSWYTQVIYSRYYWYVQHRTDTKIYYQLYYVVVPYNNFIAHVGRSGKF